MCGTQCMRGLPTRSVWVLGDDRPVASPHPDFLDNAGRYTPERKRICVFQRRGRDGAQLDIKDAGPGIPAQDLNRIFGRVYRADCSRRQEPGGSGLGLAFAKWIAQTHGTGIKVSSQYALELRRPPASRCNKAT